MSSCAAIHRPRTRRSRARFGPWRCARRARGAAIPFRRRCGEGQGLGARILENDAVVVPVDRLESGQPPDSRQVRIWRDWCQGRCKRFITMFPTFFAVKQQCPRTQPGCWYLNYFIFGDTHYNSAGEALAADVLIDSLNNIPPAKREPAATSKSAPQDQRPEGPGL